MKKDKQLELKRTAYKKGCKSLTVITSLSESKAKRIQISFSLLTSV